MGAFEELMAKLAATDKIVLNTSTTETPDIAQLEEATTPKEKRKPGRPRTKPEPEVAAPVVNHQRNSQLEKWEPRTTAISREGDTFVNVPADQANPVKRDLFRVACRALDDMDITPSKREAAVNQIKSALEDCPVYQTPLTPTVDEAEVRFNPKDENSVVWLTINTDKAQYRRHKFSKNVDITFGPNDTVRAVMWRRDYYS